MANSPSYSGIGSSKKITLRTTPNKPETTVSTQQPTTSIPSPRGYA